MAETIREFLAELGFKVDASSYRHFTDTIGEATRSVSKMGLAFAAGVASTAATVTILAQQYERLYYLSLRSNTTVTSIKALQYGMEQVGLAASDASSMIEGIALAMKSNPGMEGLIRGLGVQTRTANDAMRDTSEIAKDLLTRLTEMPFWVAQQYAQMLGISAAQLNQLAGKLQEMRAAEAEFKRLAALFGLNLETYGKNSKEFMNALRTVWNDLHLIWLSLTEKELPVLTDFLRQAHDLIVKHIPDINKFGEEFAKTTKTTLDNVVKLAEAMDKLVTATTGWGTALEVIVAGAVYKIFGRFGFIIYGLLKVMEWYEKLKTEQDKDPNYHRKQETPGELYNPYPDFTDRMMKWFEGWWKKRGGSFEEWFDQNELNAAPEKKKIGFQTGAADLWGEWRDWLQQRRIVQASYSGMGMLGGGMGSPFGGGGGGVNRGAPGYSPNEADAGSSAFFDKLEKYFGLPEGTLDRVWWAESGRGRAMRSSAGAEGHFQFMPGTAREYGLKNPYDLTESALAASRYLSDLMKRYGNDLAKALAAYNWGPGNVDRAVNQFGDSWRSALPSETRQYLDRIMNGMPLGVQGSGRAVMAMNQTTTIHVHGSGDAVRAANEVSNAQRRVNADLVRNLQGAVLA